MKILLHIILIITALLGAAGCIEDGFSTSPSDQPQFSTDTLAIGDVFTDERTTTHRFLVYNPHKKSLSISDIRVEGKDAGCFRINVDGIAGQEFSAVEIRPNDSIFVLVDAFLPETAQLSDDYEAELAFTTNGVTQSVVLTARGINAIRHRAEIIEADTRLAAGKPHIIYDSLVVAQGSTLTVEAGTTLHFHDKSSLIVRGTLISEGTPEAKVNMAGDRTGNVVTDISFDIMSRQWRGILFTGTSAGNMLTCTDIRNTEYGVILQGDTLSGYPSAPQLRMLNCRLHNSGALVLEALHSAVEAAGCEFAEGSEGLVYLLGGRHSFANCTFSNNYLFTVISGPAIQLAHLSGDPKTGFDDGSGLPYLSALFANSIIYGLGSDLSHGDLKGTDVTFRRCLLKSKGTDDDNFIECLWDEDPLFHTVRNEYIFDYRLHDESPAIGAADPALVPADAATDAYGLTRGEIPDLGAYVHTPDSEDGDTGR